MFLWIPNHYFHCFCILLECLVLAQVQNPPNVLASPVSVDTYTLVTIMKCYYVSLSAHAPLLRIWGGCSQRGGRVWFAHIDHCNTCNCKILRLQLDPDYSTKRLSFFFHSLSIMIWVCWYQREHLVFGFLFSWSMHRTHLVIYCSRLLC